jgi:TnpA family transposase
MATAELEASIALLGDLDDGQLSGRPTAPAAHDPTARLACHYLALASLANVTVAAGTRATVSPAGSPRCGFPSMSARESRNLRASSFGKIAYRHISDTYVALFTRFIPCGVWEAVYILDGLLHNDSDIQPETVHADTQGQSLPVYGLAALLGFDLLPRIRNWHDLIFFRPTPQARYRHIDSLFGAQAINWRLLQAHWPDLMRTAISVREGRISSVTLLSRLRHSRTPRSARPAGPGPGALRRRARSSGAGPGPGALEIFT